MLIVRRFFVAGFALIASASLVQAQDVREVVVTDAQVAAAATPTPDAGPRLDGARAGVRLEGRAVATRAASNEPLVPRMSPTRHSKSLMIVGGAMLLGGAIIGGDAGTIVMLGGLGVGVYGLYLYAQ